MKSLLLSLAIAAAAVTVFPSAARAHEGGAEAKKHKGAPRSFDKQPAQGTWATCAVSGDVFQVGPDTEFATVDGRTYAFCCPDCKPDFLKDPAKYTQKK